MLLNDSGIILEIMGFLLLLPPIHDSIWRFKVRNEDFYKNSKKLYKDLPFHILIKNLIEPQYTKYYKLKEKLLSIVVMVMFGLALQLTLFQFSL